MGNISWLCSYLSLAAASDFLWHIPPPLTIKCWFASGLCIEHSSLFTLYFHQGDLIHSCSFHITYDLIFPSFVYFTICMFWHSQILYSIVSIPFFFPLHLTVGILYCYIFKFTVSFPDCIQFTSEPIKGILHFCYIVL